MPSRRACGSVGGVDRVEEARVSRLLREVIIPQEGSTLTGECAGNPRILVRNTLRRKPVSELRRKKNFGRKSYPECDSNASLDQHARSDNASVAIGLLGQFCRSRRRWHADVKLRVRDIDAQGSHVCESGNKNVHGRGDHGLRVGRLTNHVALETNTIDLHTVGLNELDNSDSSLHLSAGIFEVVVVVEKLGVRVGGGSSAESNRDVSFTNDVIENVLAVRAILVQSYA
jgi:hypothetical protein